MTFQEVVIVFALAAAILLLFILVARVLIMVGRLNASFAKLGFLVREDAKKYFDDAADKIIDTNEQFEQMYKKIIEEGTHAALSSSSAITEKVVMDAHGRANEVVLSARIDAQRILQAAQKEANLHAEQTLQRTGDVVEWVMSQYLGEVYSAKEHEALIEKLVRTYINEHKS